MSVVIDGIKIEIPGLTTRSWLDTTDPLAPPANVKDSLKNDRKISGIVIHTTRGLRDGSIKLNPDGTPFVSTDEKAGMAYARYWSRKDAQAASAALIVCHNGTVLCISDLRDEVTWHATGANNFTIGIEMCQYLNGTLTKATYDSTVKLVNFLTAHFGIQRQIPTTVKNNKKVPASGIIPRLNQDNSGPAGRDFYGVFGHRNITRNRGPGDPGNVIFELLLEHGYEGFDLSKDEDKAVWRQRQAQLGIPNPDGIPGKETTARLRAAGHPHGLWVLQP